MVLNVVQAAGLVGRGEEVGGSGATLQEGAGVGCLALALVGSLCIVTLTTFEGWPLACALGVAALQAAWCVGRGVQGWRKRTEFWAPLRGEEGDLQLQESGGRLWIRAERGGAESWRPIEDFAAVDVGAAGAPAAGGEM